MVDNEPMLASFFHSTILKHHDLGSALSYILANKLANTIMPAIALREIIEETPYDPWIVQSEGRIYADENGVWLTGFRTQHQLLVPDGKYYQTREQNPGVNFRDPFTFRDQNNPSDPTEYMVFEGNSAFVRE